MCDQKRDSASQALVTAALGGLLCFALGACSSSEASAKASDAGASPDAWPNCPGAPAVGTITSTQTITDMSLAKFTGQCDAKGGVVEVHPGCGGSNTCMGMSYDIGLQTLTEHTCRGLNTCGGYSCVICG